jgi:hypothetical protein
MSGPAAGQALQRRAVQDADRAVADHQQAPALELLEHLVREGRCTPSIAARVRCGSGTTWSLASSISSRAACSVSKRPSRPSSRAWLAASRAATLDSQRRAIAGCSRSSRSNAAASRNRHSACWAAQAV